MISLFIFVLTSEMETIQRNFQTSSSHIEIFYRHDNSFIYILSQGDPFFHKETNRINCHRGENNENNTVIYNGSKSIHYFRFYQ